MGRETGKASGDESAPVSNVVSLWSSGIRGVIGVPFSLVLRVLLVRRPQCFFDDRRRRARERSDDDDVEDGEAFCAHPTSPIRLPRYRGAAGRVGPVFKLESALETFTTTLRG